MTIDTYCHDLINTFMFCVHVFGRNNNKKKKNKHLFPLLTYFYGTQFLI